MMTNYRTMGFLLLVTFLMAACAKGASPPEPCGNGKLDPLEGCDDGARIPEDGCDDACQIEPGYVCTGVPSECRWTCGDGTLDAGEQCDGGGETAVCNADCTTSRCGDGKHNVTAGEVCDEGGQTETCNANCTLVGCGDGIRGTGEQCDAGGESVDCNADCTWASCGDGKTNATRGEACDDGGESIDCNADCTVSSCGDGVRNATAGEGCDDGAESAACNADCTVSSCGDGVHNVTAGEACDDGDQVDTNDCSNACTSNYVCSDPLTTPLAGGNGWAGSMFDVVALHDVTITGFAGSFYAGTQTVELWWRSGTYVGNTSGMTGWTQLGTAVTLTGQGTGVATPIPINFSVPVNAGQRAAFWVTSHGTYGDGNIYTTGPTAGTQIAATVDLQIFSGVGTYYPLTSGSTFADRSFNGVVYYDCR